MSRSIRFAPRFFKLEDRITPQAGELDPSFNFTGQKLVSFPNVHSCSDLAIQPDGKIVLAGFAGQTYFGIAQVARLLPDGQFDTSFGDNGRLGFYFQPESAALDIVESVAMQGDKIIIAGTTSREIDTGGFPAYNTDFAVARLNPDGSFDSTFGTNGRVVIPIDEGFVGQENEDYVRDMNLDASGRIVLAGTSFSSKGYRAMSAVRLTPDGQLDTTFSGDGKVVFDYPDIDAEVTCEASAIGPGGRIALAGSFAYQDNAVFMLTESGDLDLSFGLDGRLTFGLTQGGYQSEEFRAVTFDSSGRIVAGGLSRDANGEADATVFRFLPSGALDTSFNGTGYRQIALSPSIATFDSTEALTIDSAGNILVAGGTVDPGEMSMDYVGFISRLMPNGQFDSQFGTNGNGSTTYDYFTLGGSRTTFPSSVELSDDGKILVAGSAFTTQGYVFSVSRFFGDLSLGNAPTISSIGNQSSHGAAIGPVSFTVADVETPAENLVVSGTSSNTNLVANSQIVFGGSGANRTVTVTPTQGVYGQAVITVTVTDAALATTQTTFIVEITPPPNQLPSISGIGNQSSHGTAIGPVSFTVSDAETPAGNLIVTGTSSNPGLITVSQIVFGGSGTNRTVMVTPTQGVFGQAVITVTVTDAALATAQTTFTVEITPSPNQPPSISGIGNQSSHGTAIGPVWFTVGDVETPAGNLIVTGTSSNPGLVANSQIVFGGSGTNRTVTVTPTQGVFGQAVITVTVTDAALAATQTTFKVEITAPPNQSPSISGIGNQSSQGAAIGPISFTVGDAETSAGNLIVSGTSSNTSLIANSQIVFGGSGTDRTVTVTPTQGVFGQAEITVTVTDAALATAQTTFTVAITTSPTLVGFSEFAIGTRNQFKFFNPDGTLRFLQSPFSAQSAELRTASADFTGDGIADVVVGTGPGGSSHVKIIDGSTQAELFSIDPFEASFKGGVYVATGDINGDGVADYAICPDEGGGPRVRVFDGSSFSQIADFFGIDDAKFRGGARAAIGDLNGDGNGDLLVVAGFGGGPRVSAFSGKELKSNGGPKLFGDFFAFEQTLRNGIFVAAGDVNGDGFADVVAGGGPDGGPRVYILDGKSLVQNGSANLVGLGNFFAGDISNRGGIRVAIKDLDFDNKADVVTSAGVGAGSRVTAYLGKFITSTGGTPASVLEFDAFPGVSNGVFVG